MKTKHLINLTILMTLGALLLAGCASGPYQSREEDVSDFDRIHIETFGEFLIEQGDTESLTIEAPRDYLRYLEVEVENGTLVISTRRGFLGPPVRRATYQITVTNLEEISLSGAGSIKILQLETRDLYINLTGAGSFEIDDLQAEYLEVNLSSAGAVVVAGEVETQEINLSGVGSYEAGDLRSREARINLSGAGSAVVWVEDYLDVKVSGIGSVAYFGKNPDVSQNITGLGSINGRGER